MWPAITQSIDVAQMVMVAFFAFFAGLVVYLRREDRREGYPVVDPAELGRPDHGFTGPKTYNLLEGGQATTPHHFPDPPMSVAHDGYSTGNRLSPVGNPLLAAVGPGTYVMRATTPFLNQHRVPELQPLRKAVAWSVMRGDTDPRGMAVVDAKRRRVGVVEDIWVDLEVKILRYMEVRLDGAARTAMLPIYATVIQPRRGTIWVRDLLLPQFADVPVLSHPDQITAREEDQVNAYYAGGAFFNRHGAAVRA